ncbi:phosphatidylcholine translocator ABCB4-like isoform X2 [Periplaneta americana]|uniref:phosphatidylcholine translocator ABCB4-like isoform X2 n=1 Tax=Periplaneta americana TaxID=6978 RepID=UPI0037E9A1AE
MGSEDTLHAPAPELLPLRQPSIRCSSRFRRLKGKSLLRCNSSNSSLSSLFEYEEDIDIHRELSIENLLQNTSSGSLNPQQLFEIFSSEPGSMSKEEFEDLLSLFSAMIGFTVLIAAFLQPFCWELCSSRQLHRLRQDLFSQLLLQKMVWFDSHKDKDIATQLCSRVDQVHHGIGAKMGMLLQYSATCLSGFIVAFFSNWRLTLFILPLFFVCLVVPHLLDKVYLELTSKEYSESGHIAEEIISNFKPGEDTDGSQVELNCYREALQGSQKSTLKKYYSISSAFLAAYLVANALLATALWHDWKLIEMGCHAPGAVVTVFFSVVGGMLSINKILPFAAATISARNSAKVLKTIVDHTPTRGGREFEEKSQVTRNIKFKDVSLSYPTGPKNQMLHCLNFEIKAGQSVAFVDVSGRAPTSLMDLLFGFYEPTSGQVLFDGSPGCPRSAIGVICFNPKLYSCLSVLDNIQLGKNDVEFNQIAQVAIDVGVHGYIPSLPLGYDTPVGEQFSTDLKQRIALARLAIHDPNIVVIDDITSQHAIVIEGNRTLIDAFRKVMEGRTTIVLSQRHSIIQHANTIHVLENGILCESGSHAELVRKGQLYHNWLKTQKIDAETSNGAVTRTCQLNGLGEKQRKISKFILEPELVKEDSLPSGSRCSMLCLNSTNWLWLILCLLGHICTGLGLPATARLFGDIFVPREELPRTSQFWGYIVLIIAVIVGFSFWFQSISTATCTEKLLTRLRFQTFATLLHQAEIQMETDRKKLQHIHTRLVQDLPLVRMATATRICEVVGAGISLMAAMTAAFLHGWKMELVLLLVFPAIAVAFHLKTRTIVRHQKHRHKLMQSANNIISECIQKIRTIRVMGGEEVFEDLYSKKLVAPYHAMKRHATMYAFVYALAEAGVHVLYAASFKFGFFLIQSELMGLVKVYRIFFALGICIISMSHLLVYRQEWVAAENVLKKLFQLVGGKREENKLKSKAKY